jgi:hypothetical protein
LGVTEVVETFIIIRDFAIRGRDPTNVSSGIFFEHSPAAYVPELFTTFQHLTKVRYFKVRLSSRRQHPAQFPSPFTIALTTVLPTEREHEEWCLLGCYAVWLL